MYEINSLIYEETEKASKKSTGKLSIRYWIQACFLGFVGWFILFGILNALSSYMPVLRSEAVCVICFFISIVLSIRHAIAESRYDYAKGKVIYLL